jgi:hypothetical protein
MAAIQVKLFSLTAQGRQFQQTPNVHIIPVCPTRLVISGRHGASGRYDCIVLCVHFMCAAAQVDQKINDIAQRKLKLDAAVLTGLGVTASTKASGAAAERQAMSSILEEILQEKQLSCGTCSDKS